MAPGRLIRRIYEILTFLNMPIRQKFLLFSVGVSFWFILIGLVGILSTDDPRTVGMILGALVVAHILLLLFTFSITRSLTGPIHAIISQIRGLTQGHLDELGRIVVRSGDEIGELSLRFNRLLESLQELNTFRKVIEEDDSTLEVYERLGAVFEDHGLPHHQIFQVNRSGKGMSVVRTTDPDAHWCASAVLEDETLCRARKTGVRVSSLAFPGICRYFQREGAHHICVPLSISGNTGAIVQFVCEASDREAMAALPERVDMAQRYMKEALPVLEAKLLTEQLRESAMRDPLTGLHNRRFVEDCCGSLVALAEREGNPVGFVMCDLDHFKAVNDTYGHEAGDQVLRAIADALAHTARASDVVARYGGEEFLLVLNGADRERARAVAERVRAAVEDLEVPVEGGVITLTLSAGLAVFPDDASSFWECVRLADEALYRAKREGRNRVIAWAPDPSDPAAGASLDPPDREAGIPEDHAPEGDATAAHC